MDKAKKQTVKRAVALVCAATVVALLAAMPLIAKQDAQEDGPKASILSVSAALGSVNTELIGGGTLAEEEAVTVTVPQEVKLKEFLVSNGQTVTEGTPIATVDRVTVMTAISRVQETLEYLSEQIASADDVSATENVDASAGGIVKLLYAEPGATVRDVMLEHGALAVLSLDGLMAVDLQTDAEITVGTAVTVKFSDGTEATGKVAKYLAGEMTVTVNDDDYAVGEAVEITAEDGAALGSGELYIYSPWNATAYAGTVESVHVNVGDKLTAGRTVMVLSDVGYSASFRQLIGQRQEYEEMMLDLFEMYQTETVTAPCDGVVSGIDKESVQLLSGSGQGFVLTFLANAPNGNDGIQYANYVGKVTAVGQNGWSLLVNPQPIPITDYKDLSGVPMNETAMTQVCTYPETVADEPEATEPSGEAPPAEGEAPPPEASEEAQTPAPAAEMPTPPSEEAGAAQLQTAPIYELVDGAWQQIGSASVSVGDILLFAADQSGEFVWIVRISRANSQQPTVPGGGFPSGGMGGYGQSQEPAFEMYSLGLTQIAAVTPQNIVTLDMVIDELDIRYLQVGMTAQVKIGALGGQKYTATVTEIGNTGTNNGGNSKYTVTLTMDRAENMLAGMNATATVVIDTVSDVLTLPADALVEMGNETVVYTGYDGETETLLNPVTVKTGRSDGETVEILEGLAEGETCYYAYYDTLEISYTPDFGGGFPFG